MRCAFFIVLLRPSFSHIVLSLIVKSQIRVLMLGKAFFQSKHVIDLGSVWRIGNGQSVKIRGGRWIPHIAAFTSPVSGLPPESKVSDLVDSEEHQWKTASIEQEFLPHEASIIKGIPLSILEIPDWKVWLASTHNEYTI